MSQVFKKITNQLWAVQSEFFSTNSGIFFSGNKACLIDPALLPNEILAIKDKIQEQNWKVDTLILTHHHWDHLFGPENFPDVQLISQQNYTSVIDSEIGDRSIKMISKFEKEHGDKRNKLFRFPRPDITVDKEMTIQVGEIVLNLIHAPGHTVDQMIIFEPDNGTLWAADMLSDFEIPLVNNLQDYRKTLAMLNQLDIQLLIPGHGEETKDVSEVRTRFEEDIAYLDELDLRISDSLKAGKSIEEAEEDCAEMKFKYQAENAGPHRKNVKIAYLELTAKK